jgi:hypothetical protein
LPTEFKSTTSDLVNLAQFIILPFGLDLQQIVVNFYKYVVRLFWWLALLSVPGMYIFLKKYQTKAQATYFLLTFCVSIYLLAYYGSWVFSDQLTLNLNRLGISYVRYFLPIYILGLPFVAVAMVNFVNLFKNNKIRIFIGIFFALMTVVFSLSVLFISGEDNLVKTKQYLGSYQTINAKVTALTPGNAVIISERADKIFFPERKVIGRWEARDFDYWAVLLDDNIPLYYYAYENEDFMNKLNDALYPYGLELASKTQITDKENLYQINWIPYDEED